MFLHHDDDDYRNGRSSPLQRRILWRCIDLLTLPTYIFFSITQLQSVKVYDGGKYEHARSIRRGIFVKAIKI